MKKVLVLVVGIILVTEFAFAGVAFVVQDGAATVTHQFTGDKAKIKKAYNKAARELYSGTQDEFDLLTDQEKLDIVHAFIIRQVKEKARRRIINDAQAIGTVAGNTEYQTTMELNDL